MTLLEFYNKLSFIIYLYECDSISNLAHILREANSEIGIAAHKVSFLYVNILWSQLIITPKFYFILV